MKPSTTSLPSSVNVTAFARPSSSTSTRVGSSPSRSIAAPRRKLRTMPRECSARASSGVSIPRKSWSATAVMNRAQPQRYCACETLSRVVDFAQGPNGEGAMRGSSSRWIGRLSRSRLPCRWRRRRVILRTGCTTRRRHDADRRRRRRREHVHAARGGAAGLVHAGRARPAVDAGLRRGRGMNAAIAVHKNYVYVGSRTDANNNNANHAGVMVVDVSDPTKPFIAKIDHAFEGNSSESSRELRVWRSQEILIVLHTNCGGATAHLCARRTAPACASTTSRARTPTHPEAALPEHAATRTSSSSGRTRRTRSARCCSPPAPAASFQIYDISPRAAGPRRGAGPGAPRRSATLDSGARLRQLAAARASTRSRSPTTASARYFALLDARLRRRRLSRLHRQRPGHEHLPR